MAKKFTTVEMHTGGEPVRIITSGYPNIQGTSILEKRRYVREHLDHLRRLLLFEPRGHADMYGVIPVEPDEPGADLAVLFMHNEGYSTMCGHAVIALGRYAVDQGIVEIGEPETKVSIQCPCGVVIAHVTTCDGKPSKVRFQSVPAFAFALDKEIATSQYGPINIDIGYGGAFYAVVPAERFGLDVRASRTCDLVQAATIVSNAVKEQVPLYHPGNSDLAFLYGSILTDGRDEFSSIPSANICVFANQQVDRSPTGSGVTARIAIQHHRHLIGMNEVRAFESVTGALFTGSAIRKTTCGEFKGVIVEVAGEAHYSGECVLSLEETDKIGAGFLLS